MADSNRYQPYSDYYWCGSSAMYWDYPPPVYTYGEPEARSRRPSATPVSASATVSNDVLVVDSPISGPGNGESDSENDVHPTLSTDRQNEVNVFCFF